jgi:hypothetical protein
MQSCRGLNNPDIPIKQNSIQQTQSVTSSAYNQSFNLDFLTPQGQGTTLWQEGTQLQAKIEEELSLPYGLSHSHNLTIGTEQGKITDQLMCRTIDQQGQFAYGHLSKGEQSAAVYMASMKLMDESNSGTGKEKATEDEWLEKLNSTTQLTTHSLADEQIVSKKNTPLTTSRTLLHMAALGGDFAKVRLFLLQGVYINVRDQFGYTPLHLATYKGHTEIVRLLLEEGADVYAAERDGVMPLHVASLHGHLTIVNLLLQKNGCEYQKQRRINAFIFSN